MSDKYRLVPGGSRRGTYRIRMLARGLYGGSLAVGVRLKPDESEADLEAKIAEAVENLGRFGNEVRAVRVSNWFRREHESVTTELTDMSAYESTAQVAADVMAGINAAEAERAAQVAPQH